MPEALSTPAFKADCFTRIALVRNDNDTSPVSKYYYPHLLTGVKISGNDKNRCHCEGVLCPKQSLRWHAEQIASLRPRYCWGSLAHRPGVLPGMTLSK
jgi:hypothetical protein